jgi:simple sugar transport system ATP-binding protein
MARPYLLMKHITKLYRVNGVLANDHVTFELEKGEIHALVGENGAGKTTLMRILDGVEHADEGEIFFKGQPAAINSPRDAIRLGIGMVHQHFRLIRPFTAAENIILGSEPISRRIFTDLRGAAEKIRELAAHFGFDFDPDDVVKDLSVSQMQQVEIIKVLYRNAELLILDEPTSILTQQQVERLFATLRDLVDQGRTVVFISHKLNEVMEIADRVSVMRNGQIVSVAGSSETNEEKLSHLMVGAENVTAIARSPKDHGRPVYRLEDFSLRSIERDEPLLCEINLSVHEGEILGVTGVSGSGLSELEDTVSGMMHGQAHITHGRILYRDEEVTSLDSRHLRQRGMAYVPSDRLFRGVSLSSSIADNMIINPPPGLFRYGLLQEKPIHEFADQLEKNYSIRADVDLPIGTLSGGNIQKVVLARELRRMGNFILFSEPTWGVDLAATSLIYREILSLRDSGRAVLLISTDLDEILSLSDRIAVMFGGKIVGLLDNTGGTGKREIGRFMLGIRNGDSHGSNDN